jgi:hypothetical protein
VSGAGGPYDFIWCLNAFGGNCPMAFYDFQLVTLKQVPYILSFTVSDF